jgi:hypothetical protein
MLSSGIALVTSMDYETVDDFGVLNTDENLYVPL